MRRGILFLVLGGMLAFAAQAESPPVVSWKAALDRAAIRPGEAFELRLRADIQPGWHIYSIHSTNEVAPAPVFTLKAGHPFEVRGEWKEPSSHVEENPVLGTMATHEGTVTFARPLAAPAGLAPGGYTLEGTAESMACDANGCLPPESVPFSVEVKIEAGPARAQYLTRPEESARDPVPGGGLATPLTLGQFLVLAVISGLAALLMPCVYPMIPITVSFFAKEAQRRGKPPVALAALYALGIIGTFTGIGLGFSLLLGRSIVDFVADPWVNLAIASLFFVFALSLFGLFEIRLPSFVVSAAGGADRSGAIGVMIMGFAFSIASFTCTVQFVGNLLVTAAGGEWFRPMVGMLAFSATMAAPFFVLSLFPSFLASTPRAGDWMHAAKIVFAWIEIMAVVTYLAKAEIVMDWGILTRPVVLASWCFCAAVSSLYLFGLCFFKGEEPASVGWPRRFLGTAFALLTVYVGRGLNDRSLNPNLEAFLPPLAYGRSAPSAEGKLWFHDLDEARNAAKATGKPLLLNFTGLT